VHHGQLTKAPRGKGAEEQMRRMAPKNEAMPLKKRWARESPPAYCALKIEVPEKQEKRAQTSLVGGVTPYDE